jgi:glycosyltransferase involved in cell wall biosynthesis
VSATGSTGSRPPSPEVSVVIPTHNRAGLLPRTLATVFDQAGVDLEVIVVDDGSTDGTADQVAAMANPRLRLIRLDDSRGQATARNAGIEAARGEWIAFLDDDDLWAPDKVATQLEIARAEGACTVYAAVAVVDESLRLVEIAPGPPADELGDQLIGGCVIPAGCSNVLARTDRVRAVGGFDEQLSQLSDWDMWLRLTADNQVAASREVLVGYVQHPGSVMLAHRLEELVAEFDYIANKHEELSRLRGIPFDRAGLERWMAWGESRASHHVAAARRFIRAGLMYARRGSLGQSKQSVRDGVAALIGEKLTDSGGWRARDDRASPAWLERYR